MRQEGNQSKGKWLRYLYSVCPLIVPFFSQHCFTAGQVLIFLGAVGESPTVVFLCLQLNPEQALLPGIARSSMAGPGPPTSLVSGTVSCSYKGRIEGVVSKQLLQEDCYCG